ncbi:MAG: helix-turn-helix transcriptional regulator [Cryobacterium sp.]|nr:helix-turn-helix transcriptional regulator [Cryobacterium sp.]
MSLNIETSGPHIPKWNRRDRMRKAREDLGLSQSRFAAVTGMSQRMISAFESGEREPRLKDLNLWQLATGVPREWLETGEYTPRDSNPEPTD